MKRYSKNKNLSTDSIPSIPKDNTEIVESTPTENKWINKNILIILAGVVTLIGIGIWYYFYSGAGNESGVNPPDSNGDPHQISINNNKSNTLSAEPGTVYDPTNSNLIDRVEGLRDLGKISTGEYNQLR